MVTNLVISPGGNLIAAATRQGSIPIWNLAAAEHINVLQAGESTALHSLIFSIDDSRLYVGGGRLELYGTTPGLRWGRALFNVTAWDVTTGERALEFKPPEEWEGSPKLGLSRDGKELYSLDGRRFAIWEAATGALEKVIDPQRLGPPVGPPENIITINGNFSNLERYTIDSRDHLVTQIPAVRIDMAQLSDDGKRLITAADGSIHLWDAGNGVPIHALGEFSRGPSVLAIGEVAARGLVMAVGGLVDRQQTAMCSQVRAWDRYAGSLQYAVRIDGRGRNLAISPDEKLLAVIACKDSSDLADVFGPSTELVNGTIEVLDTATGNRVASLNGSFTDQMALQFSPNSDAIASIAGSTFRLWNIKIGDVQRTFELQGHTRISPPGSPSPGAALPTELYAAAIAPNLRWAATTGGRDKHVFVWNVAKGIKHKDLIVPGMGTSQLAISPDSRLLAVSARLSHDHDAANKNTITIWDPKEGRQLLVLAPDASELPAYISFSPDGKHLLSASGTSSAILWDLSAAYTQLEK
jgi:WD40 repeat protein